MNMLLKTPQEDQWAGQLAQRRAVIDQEIAARAARVKGGRGYADSEGFGARANRQRVARRVESRRQRAASKQRRATDKGRRPTTPERRAEMLKVRSGSAKLLRPLVVDRASQIVLSEQRRRDLGARTLKSGAVTIRRVPPGLTRATVTEEAQAVNAIKSKLWGLHGPGLLAMAQVLKDVCHDKAEQNAEKIVVGRCYVLRKDVTLGAGGALQLGRGESVEVLKVGSTSAVVQYANGREQKVSTLQLVVDPAYVPGTRRAGRKELKNVLREEFTVQR